MRLSEAIQLGAMWSPQTRGAFFRPRGEEVATCALGAAVQASGVEVHDSLSRWPILHVMVQPTELPRPIRGRSHPMRVMDVIVGLNDLAGWTRTMISDWVESVEDCHPESSGQIASFDPNLGVQFKFGCQSDEDSEDDMAGLCVG